MLYVRKLFKQDLRDGKQIAFPKEPSLSFFSFDYINKEEDRKINFTFKAAFNEFKEHDGKVITSRLYAAGSEARMDGEVKAFIRDELDAKIADLLIFKNKGTKHTDYEVMFLPQNNPFYPMFLALTNGDNHSVCVVEDEDLNVDNDFLPFQQIFYGAPGTGKSHRIKEQLKALNVPKENIFRTTFHPDSDFSTFVGAYKPTMKKQYRYDGKVKAKYYEDDDLANAKKDDVIIDKVIQYDFVPQTFIKAYVRAYQTNENVYLIIEEINRGNCAQIFGDLFQLLDRDENGISEYTIKADADIRSYLEDVLGCDSKGIKDGELCLPSNLYIYATMNTSDQSLFPIDSAFKRRWDWEYEPIKYKNADWVIEINGNQFSWTSFQKEVNNRIFESTNSEDKMLGDFFVKPYDGIITEKLLLNKVLFYLWNDVCKDGDGDIFKTEDNKDVKFSDLYGENGTTMLLSMMKHLKVELLSESDDDVEEEENSKDNTKYSINGSGSYAKRSLSTELVKVYISQHPEMLATEVVNKWKSLGKFVSHFIETQDEYDTRTDHNPRVNIIPCNGDNIYVSTNGWGGQGVMDSLINAIPKDWNLNVEKI